MKRVLGISGTLTCIVLHAAVTAAPVPDEELVQSAIAAEVRTGDQAVLRDRLDRSKRRLTEAMTVDPNTQVGGVVVFRTGLSSKEVAAFAQSHKLEVTRAEAKVAVAATGVVQTMSFGAQSLFFLDGPLEERLEKLVGRQRGMFMADAANAADASKAAGLREAAYSRDIRFYKVEVVGPAASFDQIGNGSEAAAAFIDDSGARVDDLAVQKTNAARLRSTGTVIKGRPYEQGPPPGVVVSPTAVLGNHVVAPPDPVKEQPKR